MAHYKTDDIVLAAALLELSGAAVNDRRIEFRAVEKHRPGWRHILVSLDSTDVDDISTTLKTPWTDRETGQTYAAGETVKLPRVVFALAGKWVTYTTAAQLMVDFTDDDWKFWVREFYRDSGLLSGLRAVNENINKLRDVMRARHGVKPRLRMPFPSPTGGGIG